MWAAQGALGAAEWLMCHQAPHAPAQIARNELFSAWPCTAGPAYSAVPDGWQHQHCNILQYYHVPHVKGCNAQSLVRSGEPTAANSTMWSDPMSKPVVCRWKATNGRLSCRRPAAWQSGRFQASCFTIDSMLANHQKHISMTLVVPEAPGTLTEGCLIYSTDAPRLITGASS